MEAPEEPSPPSPAPLRRRNNVRLKLAYLLVLIASGSVSLFVAALFVTISFLRFHLEVPWLQRFTDMEIILPIGGAILLAIYTLRFFWMRCTKAIEEESRWNAEVDRVNRELKGRGIGDG